MDRFWRATGTCEIVGGGSPLEGEKRSSYGVGCCRKRLPFAGCTRVRGSWVGPAERELALGEARTRTPALGRREVVGKADPELRGHEAGRFKKDRKTR